MDPRTSTPRDIEDGPRRLATSRLVEILITASPPNPEASRARCLLGLLRIAPGGRTFQAPPRSKVRRLSTALVPKRCPARLTVLAAIVSGACVACGWHAGTKRLGPPEGKVSAASPTPPPRPPLPAPRLETLIRHPSLPGRDDKDYNQARGKVNSPIGIFLSPLVARMSDSDIRGLCVRIPGFAALTRATGK
jgi:hypothetical protein